jgi:hypothetical protein
LGAGENECDLISLERYSPIRDFDQSFEIDEGLAIDSINGGFAAVTVYNDCALDVFRLRERGTGKQQQTMQK